MPAAVLAGLAALGLSPARVRLQRGVERLLFGRRAEPYGVLSDLGVRLDATDEPADALESVVETVATTLRLPYVVVVVSRNGEEDLVTAHGTVIGRTSTFPLLSHGATVGNLVVGHRSADEDFTAEERALLEALARQARAIVGMVRLADELREISARRSTGREEERLRLHRDLS